MAQRIFIIISLLFLVVLFVNAGFDAGESSFEILVTKAKNDTLRNQLIAFKRGGIEKSVDTVAFQADSLLDYARTFIGTPHRMGGTTKKGIDCSGLVKVAFGKYGVNLPHTCQEQARYGKIIADWDSLQKGDMVFFYKSFRCRDFITHSGIYSGDGNFIHTSSSRGVTISKLQDKGYWEERYLFGTRLYQQPDSL